MRTLQKLLFSSIFSCFACCAVCQAQIGGGVSAASLRSQVEFLSSPLCAGRAVEDRGAVEAAFWITRQMIRADVLPLSGTYMHSSLMSGRVIRNVIGIVPSEKPSDKYIVICAHYDGIGELNGTLYPGADSNASGVAAMLSLSQSVRMMRVLGKGLPVNLIFAAVDSKQVNMYGAEHLYREISEGRLVNPGTGAVVRKKQISMFVNLDILGGTMSPIRSGNPDYLIMLGGGERQRQMLRDAVGRSGTGLQLGFDYYGSKDFTDLFFRRISDQKPFLANGIPCVMFTSGITLNTNRVTDTADSLDYEVFRRRVSTIAVWLETLSYSL